MKKGMTIFALTTILCGAAAVTDSHNQAFARSGSHSSGHSASSGRSSHSSGHSASSGRSSHSSGHSASSGRSSHSSAHSANSGKNSHSKGHSATAGRNSSSKGHSATVGRNSNTKGHGAVVNSKSNSKGKNTKNNRNSKPSNLATKGKSTNVNKGSHSNKRTTSNLNATSSKNNKLNTAKNNNKKSNAVSNKANVKGKATNHKNQSLTSKKGNNSKTSKVTKNNKKNSNKTNLVSKRNQNKKGTAVNSKKNNKKNFKNNKLATKGKVVSPKKKTNLTPKVATKKYKTKQEISKLSTWSILKYVYQHRNGSKINELHGCYCGPFFGDTKKGPKPVDILDRLCRQHDIGYEKKGYFNRQVNNEFIAGVNKYASKMKPAEREKAYYFAEGFKRMNNTPLQEVAKAFNLASKPFSAVANFISNGAKSIGNLFNGNRTSTINKNSNNFDRGGSNGKNSYPWLKKPRVAR